MEATAYIAPLQLSVPSVPGLGRGVATNAAGAKLTARKAAEEFESVFLTAMLEGMFAGLKTEVPFGGGSSEKVYRSMLVGEYAKSIANSGGIGIADHVYRQILAVQENAK